MGLSDLAGVWNLQDSINFDEYLKQCGIGYLTRKLAATIKPVLTITVDGDNVSINSCSTFKNHTTSFKLNQEFEENSIDGRVFKTIFTWANEKLIQKQTAIKPEDKASVMERYVKDGKLFIDMDCEGVKAQRIYTKAENK
uniref:Lipocln_cytosolic_FA-bd_dom domain-containing protein n=1 Tax=Parastrongyloides trichosuri TaxID=131310 RepID=A0A0N4Z5X9_PARTI